MAAATENQEPEIVETLSSPERVHEIVVWHEDAVRLNSTDPDARIRRPEGARLVARNVPKGSSADAEGGDKVEGRMVAQVRFAAGRKFEAMADPAVLPIEALDRAAWLHRWTIETVERRLGRDPEQRVIARAVFDVAYLATVPPEVGMDSSRHDVSSTFEPGETKDAPPGASVSIDRDALVAWVTDELARTAVDSAERLEAAVGRPGAGLVSEGWIAVVCHEDGSARYRLLPTNAWNHVLNAELFCAALESRLARAE
jgi:hypothetical protein